MTRTLPKLFLLQEMFPKESGLANNCVGPHPLKKHITQGLALVMWRNIRSVSNTLDFNGP
jgi:hypothetical protein